MSTRSTLRSADARLAARLMAVVVFPTPPFWFEMQMTRPTEPSVVQCDWMRGVACWDDRATSRPAGRLLRRSTWNARRGLRRPALCEMSLRGVLYELSDTSPRLPAAGSQVPNTSLWPRPVADPSRD